MNKIFKDTNGKVILWQWPNALLYGWVALKLTTILLANGWLKNGASQLGTALLFAWAYLELTSGVNYFRRFLGFTILVVLTIGFFKH